MQQSKSVKIPIAARIRSFERSLASYASSFLAPRNQLSSAALVSTGYRYSDTLLSINPVLHECDRLYIKSTSFAALTFVVNRVTSLATTSRTASVATEEGNVSKSMTP